MKFMLKCDLMDGFVLIDKYYLSELDDCMLYAMDILLDPLGKSELIFDFPNEAWNDVRLRETKSIREFCNDGKMIIWLLDDIEKEIEIQYNPNITDSLKCLHLPTGQLLAVTASELIQCLSYPELEMEKIFELEMEAGWYAICEDGIEKIMYDKIDAPNFPIHNILL